MPRVGDQHFPYTPAGYAAAAKAKESRGYSNGGPARIPPFTPAPVRRPAPIAPPIGRAPPPPMLVRPTPIPAQAQNPFAPVAPQIAPAEKTDTARKVDIIWNKLFADNKPKDKPNRPKAPMKFNEGGTVNPLYAQALAGGADINGDGTISEAELGAWRPADARYGVGHGGRHLNADNVAWLRDKWGVPVQADGSIAEADFINWARENDRHGTGVNRAAWDAGADTDNSGLLSSEELYSWKPPTYQEPPGTGAPPADINPRIQELMDRHGMTYEQAVAHNASAVTQGGDLNNDGFVTNEEWQQFKDSQPPPPPATADMTTMQNPYVFGGYGAPPSMPYAGMATPQIPSIMGMAPPSYYGGSAQPVGMADPTQRVS